MNDLKISVIIPIYNVEQFLDECIESVINQTYKNLEIILVDDGSPDNCPQICDKWAKKDARIKVIHKKNGGVSSARNAGLCVATGDYIHFVDSDDVVDIHCYNICVNEILKKPNVLNVAFFSTHNMEELGENVDIKDVNKSNICQIYTNGLARSVWRYLYKRDCIKTLFCENISYDEDHVFNVCYKADNFDNYDCIIIPKRFYFYRNNDQSLSNVFKENYFKDILYVKNIILTKTRDLNLSIEEKMLLYKNMQWCFLSNIQLLAKSKLEFSKKINQLNYLFSASEFIFIQNKVKHIGLKYRLFDFLVKLKMYRTILMILGKIRND